MTLGDLINIPNKYQEHCTLDRRFCSQPSDSLTNGLGVLLPPHLLNPATQKSSQICRVAFGIPKGIKWRMIDNGKISFYFLRNI
jgi:hypothetical protein